MAYQMKTSDEANALIPFLGQNNECRIHDVKDKTL